MRTWKVVLWTLVGAAGSLALLGATAVWAVNGGLYGCTDEDEALTEKLRDIPIVDAHPGNAAPVGPRYAGCEEDDQYTSVARYYRTTGSHQEVDAFYRKAAAADGWRPTGSGYCYQKRVAGVTAYLSAGFPQYPGEEDAPDEYLVEVTADLDMSLAC